MASRGSAKLFLALSVMSFTDSLHTPTSCLTMSPRERINILWECIVLIDVLDAVVVSAQSAFCARLRCTLEDLQIAQIQQMRQQMHWSFDENRLHQFFRLDFQDNNWHFYRLKFKLYYRIIYVFEYLNHYNK